MGASSSRTTAGRRRPQARSRAALSRRRPAPPHGIDKLLGEVRTGRFERSLAALTAGGAAITAAEIYTSHDSASFGNRVMWWPVVVIPTLIPAGIASVFSRRVAKTVLPVASALVVANGFSAFRKASFLLTDIWPCHWLVPGFVRISIRP